MNYSKSFIKPSVENLRKKALRVAITGTPGTGKSTVSKIISKKMGCLLVDVNEFAEKQGLFVEKDVKRSSWIVDEKKLKKETDAIKGNVILDGHLSHFCRADIVIALRLNPAELKKRLSLRGWSADKIKENVEAEALDVCFLEARKKCKNVFEIDATGKSQNALANEVIALICGKNREKYAKNRVNWSFEFVSVLRESI
ncbi:MAG: adenylate kinase family protein [Candidatus Aenigmarchaeota archaeon]|nr:adenylate kinase family protein [Candidatus Aenigmarchaeota archaeon]